MVMEATKESCNGSYVDVDPNHAECFENLELVDKMIKDINKNHILEPKCTWASPGSNGESDRRSLKEKSGDFILSPPQIPDFWCHGTVKDWKRCNRTLSYVQSVLDVHRNLSKYGLQVLVYNGDHDLTVPNSGTEAWIDELDLPVVNYWRPWIVDGQIAGYTIKYSTNGYRLTYATIKGAGHSPQEYKRRECFDMFERFIHYYPL